jgi:hypothetical protein
VITDRWPLLDAREPVSFYFTHTDHNVRMEIEPVVLARRMPGDVSDVALVRELLAHEFAGERDTLLLCHFVRQGEDEVFGELSVTAFRKPPPRSRGVRGHSSRSARQRAT